MHTSLPVLLGNRPSTGLVTFRRLPIQETLVVAAPATVTWAKVQPAAAREGGGGNSEGGGGGSSEGGRQRGGGLTAQRGGSKGGMSRLSLLPCQPSDSRLRGH